MDSKILEYVIAIAENRSLSKTAEQFYLSQPILSRHVKNIEQELGAQLFIRAHNQMLLTDAGRIYINNARAILYTEQKLMIDLENLRSENRSIIRVMIDPYLRPLFERAVLPEFRAAFQKCDVQLSDGNEKLAEASLKNKLIDLAVLKGRLVGTAPENTRIFYRDELVLAVPQEWGIPEQTIAGEMLRSLGQRCLLMEQADPVMRECERWLLGSSSAAANAVIEVEGSANLIKLVVQKKGAAILPLALADAYKEHVTILHFKPEAPFFIYGQLEASVLRRKEETALLTYIQKAYDGMNHYMKKIVQH